MRTLLVCTALLFVGATMAGCLAGEDDLPNTQEITIEEETLWVLDALGERLDEGDFGGELPAFEIVRASDRISGEPTIGVTRTGAIFYAAIEFDVDVAGQTTLPSTWYMRSTDNGTTWEKKNPQMAGVETHPTSFDPYVYVDPTTGRVFAMDMGPHVACNKVSWSDDDGESWMTREGACIPGANDHPTLFAGPATPWTNTAVYPNHLYLCTNQITDSICYNSPDGGINWLVGAPAFLGYDPNRAEIDTSDPPNSLVDGALEGLCGGLHGHGHASWADGTIYLGRDWCNEVAVAVSHDGGLTFEKMTISTEPYHAPSEHDVSIGTDRSGNAYAFWIGDRGRSTFLSVSKDQGVTWSEPMNVTAPGITAAKLPSLVAGDDGRIAFLYVGTTNPYGHRIGATEDGERMYPSEYENATWNAYIGMSLNADSDAPVFATKMANHPDEPLKRGDCVGRCMGDKGGMYDFLDIEIDPMTGQVFAALVDVCTDDCEGAGKAKSDVTENSMGAVAVMVSGTKLLDAPIEER